MSLIEKDGIFSRVVERIGCRNQYFLRHPQEFVDSVSSNLSQDYLALRSAMMPSQRATCLRTCSGAVPPRWLRAFTEPSSLRTS